MYGIDRKWADKAFKKYVSNYDLTDERVKLKMDHTYRVAELCARIAKQIGCIEEEIELAWLIGLLHDFGRFEQLRRYDTFMDAKSVEHGQLGVELLYKERNIHQFIDVSDYDIFIQKAIWYHSAYQLPKKLKEKERVFCQILRDADKIDILKVNVEVPIEIIYGAKKEDVQNSVVTEEVMNQFLNHQTILHVTKKTIVDRLVGHLSLVFGLEYAVSVNIVKKQGYLEKILAFQSDNSKTRQQFKEIKECIQQYLVQRNNKK